MEKKYQIFISSTYTDLKKARQKVIDAILKIYHIPIGMEMFSAANDEQWEIIKRTIKSSDYYIVIVGFRYGSETREGISYTEKEYDYAIENGIPVLAFIKDRNSPTLTTERDINQDKVNNFISKLESRMRETWSSIDELSYIVTAALYKQFTLNPQKGWIRGKAIDISEKENSSIIKITKENVDHMLSINYGYEIEKKTLKITGSIKNTSTITVLLVEGIVYLYNKQNDVYHIGSIYFTHDSPLKPGIRTTIYQEISAAFEGFNIDELKKIYIEITGFFDYNNSHQYRVLIE